MPMLLRFPMVLVLLAMASWGAQAQPHAPCLLDVQDEEGRGLPGATVWLDGEPVGTTNVQGQWLWHPQVANGTEHVLEVTSIGFDPVKVVRQCAQGESWSVVLTPNTVALGGATVVGGLKPMTTKASPIQTQVISGAALQLVHAQDVVESLDFTNGVRETVGCGICGTNDIHMNGMEGAYTLVLIDGVPLLGGLASAYALDGIPVSMVQQVEVIHGPASARFGSQAVGGVINVVLSPLRQGQASSMVRWDTHGRGLVAASGSFGVPESMWQVGVDGLHFARRIDDNEDGMTDAPTMDRVVTTLRHQGIKERRRSRMTLRLLGEQRFGGALDFQESDRGTDKSYGERIDLWRSEWLWGSSPRAGKGMTFQGGASHHRQSSTYGLTSFDAEEFTASVDAYSSGHSWAKGQSVQWGTSLLWDVYRDETLASSDMNVWVPAVYGEYSGSSNQAEGSPKWSWTHGVRVERPSDRQWVVAPRVNVKWSPHPLWDVRLNSGRGYRRVHLFTEEHAALDGSREVMLSEGGLNPESSWNVHAHVAKTVGNDLWSGTWTLSAFGTLFTDRIYADFDSLPNAILYRNVEGLGWNRGVSSDFWMTTSNGWSVTAGMTWLRSELIENGMDAPPGMWRLGEGTPIEFAPRWTGNCTLGRRTKNGWNWSVVAQSVGRMALPYYDDATSLESDPYALVHASVQKACFPNWKGVHNMTLGVQNATGTRQPSPILGAGEPFSEAFDASRVYGPIEGCRFFLEWAWAL